MLFHLEIVKNNQFSNIQPFINKYGLKECYFYQKTNVRFFVYSYLNRQEVNLLENTDKLLFIHGQSSNITINNYSDINDLYGNFNLITISKTDSQVEFIKDFTNSFDSFKYEDEERIIISNNPLWIKTKGISIDYYSVAQYLLTIQGVFPSSYFYNEIKKILPGSYIKINTLGIIENYLNDVELTSPNFESFFEEFNIIIKNSISDKDGVDLTGGYDSRLVKAAAIHNKLKTIGVVHGEEDEEVNFVKRMAKKLGIQVVSLEINDIINSSLEKWENYFFLSGGYYNLFESIKEGARSIKRSEQIPSKVGGSMGEVIRDKWYVSKITRKILLNENSLLKLVLKKLLNTNVVYTNCTNYFKDKVEQFRNEFSNELANKMDSYESYDVTQKYMRIVFEYYTRGWNGCLYNLHNNILKVVAPYMDNQFYLKCLNVDADFRNYSQGITKAINQFTPSFKNIPFIDGQLCKPVKGLNLARYLFFHYMQEFKSRILKHPQKKEYNHAEWLKRLLDKEKFAYLINENHIEFNTIIEKENFDSLILKGLNNKLSSHEYIFLWKLISLKFSIKSMSVKSEYEFNQETDI